MPTAKLFAKAVAAAIKPGYLSDGGGLYLQVTPAGVRSWLLRYERGGRERAMGLGPVADFTLEEAREAARKARQILFEGKDPIDSRKDARSELRSAAAKAAARAVTFKACAEMYYNFHSPKWKNIKHSRQFLSTLQMYVYPVLGSLPVEQIDKALVLKAIEPIWYTKTETASRVRGRIESVLDFAQVRGYRSGDNPAVWDGNLKHLLPAPTAIAKVEHHAALPFADAPMFLLDLLKRQGIAARALEFLILTAARTSEVTGAQWSEINFEAKIWTVPAQRMKMKKEHRVPLVPQAIEILEALPRETVFIFPGGKKDSALSNMAMAVLLKRMDRLDITVHGFRSTFRDWAAECTNSPNHVVEMALAHVVGDKVEAAYRRGDLFEKRIELMADWASYCAGGRR